MAQWLTNLTRNREVAGSIPGLAVNCGVGRRHGLDPELLWLWCRLVATAPTRPLAWEPPYTSGAALEKGKRQKQKTNKKTSVMKNDKFKKIQSLKSWLYKIILKTNSM